MVENIIMCFSREAGGAEAIAPVVKILHEKYNVILLAKDYACDIFQRHSLLYLEIKEFSSILAKQLIDRNGKPELLLTSATSLPWNDMNERYIWKWGEHEGIRSIAVVDQWQNYSIRFSGTEENERLKYMPDYICTMDEYSRSQMIQEGIPAGKIVVTGQPAFDSLAIYAKNFSRQRYDEIRAFLGVKSDEKLIVFVSEALYQDFGTSLGYTESSTLSVLLKSLVKIKESGIKFTLVVKLHPQNNPDDFRDIDFERYRNQFNVRMIAKDIPPRDLVLSSDVVIGMASALLIESIMLGRITMSLQLNTRNDDNLIATKIGAIPLISDKSEFEKMLKPMLIDKNFREEYKSSQKKLFSDGRAAKRIVELAEKVLKKQTLNE